MVSDIFSNDRIFCFMASLPFLSSKRGILSGLSSTGAEWDVSITLLDCSVFRSRT